MRAVNLMPREAKRTSGIEQNLPLFVGLAVGVIVVASLAGLYLMGSAKVADAQRGLQTAKAQFAATPLPPAAPATLPTPPAVASTQQPLLDAVSLALSQRIAWDRVLREFSLVLPSDVWLTSMTLTAPTPGAASATGLQLDGATYSYGGVARLLSRLALVPDLTAVTLTDSSRTDKLIDFSITAGVKGAPAAPAAPSVPTTTTPSS